MGQEDQEQKIVRGDQLLNSQVRELAAQRHVMNANNPQARLDGIVHMIEDWHT